MCGEEVVIWVPHLVDLAQGGALLGQLELALRDVPVLVPVHGLETKRR